MIYRKRYYLRHPLVFWHHAVTRPVRRFVQRGRRGWADQDVWSFDTYLAEVISGGVEYLRVGHSYPGEMPEDEWDGDDGILHQIGSGFHDYVDGKFTWDDDDPGYAKFNESMALFVKWYGHLWD